MTTNVDKNRWLPGKNSSKTINAAWISGGFVLVGAIIGLNSHAPSTSLHQGQMLYNPKGITTVTNNYYNGDNAAGEAVKEFEKKLNNTNEKVEITRKELGLLSKALKDLDERTSAIQKLPDGKTQFGGIVSGEPKIVIDNFNLAVNAFNSGKYAEAFVSIKKSIQAYEAAKNVKARMRMGDYTPKFVAQLYRSAGIMAQVLKMEEVANSYAEKSLQADSSDPASHAFYATTLFNLHEFELARKEIDVAIAAESKNSEFQGLKTKINSKIKHA